MTGCIAAAAFRAAPRACIVHRRMSLVARTPPYFTSRGVGLGIIPARRPSAPGDTEEIHMKTGNGIFFRSFLAAAVCATSLRRRAPGPALSLQADRVQRPHCSRRRHRSLCAHRDGDSRQGEGLPAAHHRVQPPRRQRRHRVQPRQEQARRSARGAHHGDRLVSRRHGPQGARSRARALHAARVLRGRSAGDRGEPPTRSSRPSRS